MIPLNLSVVCSRNLNTKKVVMEITLKASKNQRVSLFSCNKTITKKLNDDTSIPEATICTIFSFNSCKICDKVLFWVQYF